MAGVVEATEVQPTELGLCTSWPRRKVSLEPGLHAVLSRKNVLHVLGGRELDPRAQGTRSPDSGWEGGNICAYGPGLLSEGLAWMTVVIL